MKKIIDLGDTANIIFNGNPVEILKLNADVIWRLPAETDYILNVQRGAINIYNSETATTSTNEIISFDVTAGEKEATVTYGDVVRTIPANSTETITFGLFNGVDDGTLTSGEITFSGGYTHVAPSEFPTSDTATSFVHCIVSIVHPFGTQMTNTQKIYMYQTLLTSCVLPEHITSIGLNAFNGCTGLTTIRIPENVTSIDKQSFYGCTALASVLFDENSQLKTIGNSAFANTKLTNITLPNSVTYIDFGAFQMCSSLTSIEISENVTSIGSSVFSSCSALETLTFKMPASAEITLGTSLYGSNKSAKALTIYTDNSIIANYGYSTDNVTPTLYHLDKTTLWEKLATPTITLDGSTLIITPVENASYYVVMMKSEMDSVFTEFVTTTETTIDLSSIVGDYAYTIYVKAYNDGYLTSTSSNVTLPAQTEA